MRPGIPATLGSGVVACLQVQGWMFVAGSPWFLGGHSSNPTDQQDTNLGLNVRLYRNSSARGTLQFVLGEDLNLLLRAGHCVHTLDPNAIEPDPCELSLAGRGLTNSSKSICRKRPGLLGRPRIGVFQHWCVCPGAYRK